MSGLACPSHATRFPVRLRTELTFHVAIFIAAGSDAEGVAAAAGRGGVRVLHLERGADHFLDIVELAALEKLQRGAVDQHCGTVALDHQVVLVALLLEREVVLEAGTSAT